MKACVLKLKSSHHSLHPPQAFLLAFMFLYNQQRHHKSFLVCWLHAFEKDYGSGIRPNSFAPTAFAALALGRADSLLLRVRGDDTAARPERAPR